MQFQTKLINIWIGIRDISYHYNNVAIDEMKLFCGFEEQRVKMLSFKVKVHPDIKFVLIGAEKWAEQVGESFSKFRLQIWKTDIFYFLSCYQSKS